MVLSSSQLQPAIIDLDFLSRYTCKIYDRRFIQTILYRTPLQPAYICLTSDLSSTYRCHVIWTYIHTNLSCIYKIDSVLFQYSYIE